MVTRTQCPKCAALGKDTRGDNLAIYPDGHGHCYGCHWHKFPSQFVSVKNMIQVEETKETVVLPDDATDSIDAVALAWLSKYGIELKEVIANKMLWSPRTKMLIFPIYTETKEARLLGWQGRSFSDVYNRKYFNVGPFNDFFHLINLYEGKGDDVVVVEDILSAIKVGRQKSTLPLFGSYLTTIQMKRLKNVTEELTFWLDEDKAQTATALARAASQLGFTVRVVVTKLDPKEYTNEEIADTLNSRH